MTSAQPGLDSSSSPHPAASEPQDGAVRHGELGEAPSVFRATALLSQM